MAKGSVFPSSQVPKPTPVRATYLPVEQLGAQNLDNGKFINPINDNNNNKM